MRLTGKQLVVAMSLTFLYNVLHFPAGHVPVTITRADECAFDKRRAQEPGFGTDSFTRDAESTLHGAEGLPAGVQIATLPYQDEQCMRVMRDLEDALPFTHLPPTLSFL